MKEPEKRIQKSVADLTRDFMTIMKNEISQIEKGSESKTAALRDSLTFLDLMKDELNRSIENKKNELLQSHGTKTE